MKNKLSLSIGDRFQYLNEHYEICHINNDVIRYSNFINGNMYFITKEDLIHKILNGISS